MKKLIASLFAALLLSSAAYAQGSEMWKGGKLQYRSACTSERDNGDVYVATNASDQSSCDADQTKGDLPVICVCSAVDDVYAWRLWNSSGAVGDAGGDLSAYVLLAGDADGQTIQGSSAAGSAYIEMIGSEAQLSTGNSSPSDNEWYIYAMNSEDYGAARFSVYSEENNESSVTATVEDSAGATAASFTMGADGATEISAASTTVSVPGSAGNARVEVGVDNDARAYLKSGEQGVTAFSRVRVAANGSVSLDSLDDTGATRASVVLDGDQLVISTKNGAGDTVGQFYIDTDSSLPTIEAGSAATALCTSIQGVRYCGAVAAAPYTCDGGDPVGYYTDTTGPDLCYCNGSAWAPVDGSGTCA